MNKLSKIFLGISISFLVIIFILSYVLIKKLSMKSTQTLNESDEGETVTETYGYFLDNYGFTPTVIISKSGKQEAGFIGYKSETDLKKFIKEKGID